MPRAEVEHDIDHALARPMVGILAATPRDMHGKARRLQKVLSLRAGAGGVERRMLQ